jgi:hypothetical protein
MKQTLSVPSLLLYLWIKGGREGGKEGEEDGGETYIVSIELCWHGDLY